MKLGNYKSFGWAIKLIYKSSPLFFGYILFYSIFEGVKSVANAFIVAKLITAVTAVAFTSADTKDVYIWLIALVIIELTYGVVYSLYRLADIRLEQMVNLQVTEIYVTKMYSLSQEQFEDQAFQTKMARARESINDVYRILKEISYATISVVTFVTSISAIIFLSPIVGIIITISIIPVAILRVKQNKQYEQVNKDIEVHDRIAFRSRWMLIDPNFMPEIRLINGFKTLLNAYKTEIKKSYNVLYDAYKRIAKIEVISEFVAPLVIFGANVHFFRQLVNKSIGLDQFIFMRGVLEQASSSAQGVASSIDRIHELSIHWQNFMDIQNTEPTIPDGKKIVDAPLTIEFKNVSFAYPGTKEKILKNLSFEIHPGSKLALVGENGAGKSTLIKLILRQYLPTEGVILINGQPIQDIKLSTYYDQIGNLSQDFITVPHLTIKDNLTIGLKTQPTEKMIYETLKLVDGEGFIKKLPHKLHSRLDTSFDEGTNLSGGQLQRVGIARTLLRDSDILLLDEPTSAVDAKAEYKIFNNIYKEHADRTTLIVSHRFSTVRKADKIIVMENGKITEYGSHEELIKFGGLYKEMFEAQAEGYK